MVNESESFWLQKGALNVGEGSRKSRLTIRCKSGTARFFSVTGVTPMVGAFAACETTSAILIVLVVSGVAGAMGGGEEPPKSALTSSRSVALSFCPVNLSYVAPRVSRVDS